MKIGYHRLSCERYAAQAHLANKTHVAQMRRRLTANKVQLGTENVLTKSLKSNNVRKHAFI